MPRRTAVCLPWKLTARFWLTFCIFARVLLRCIFMKYQCFSFSQHAAFPVPRTCKSAHAAFAMEKQSPYASVADISSAVDVSRYDATMPLKLSRELNCSTTDRTDHEDSLSTTSLLWSSITPRRSFPENIAFGIIALSAATYSLQSPDTWKPFHSLVAQRMRRRWISGHQSSPWPSVPGSSSQVQRMEEHLVTKDSLKLRINTLAWLATFMSWLGRQLAKQPCVYLMSRGLRLSHLERCSPVSRLTRTMSCSGSVFTCRSSYFTTSVGL